MQLDEDFKTWDTERWAQWGAPGPYLSKGHLHIPFEPMFTARTSGIVLRQPFTYGTVEARLRATVGNFRICALLWPDAGGTPPEIDFCEIGADDRHRTHPTQTLWHDDGSASHSEYAATMTDFQRVGVVWGSGAVAFTLNGATMSRWTWWPIVPMKLAFQVGIPFDDRVKRQSGELILDTVTIR